MPSGNLRVRKNLLAEGSGNRPGFGVRAAAAGHPDRDCQVMEDLPQRPRTHRRMTGKQPFDIRDDLVQVLEIEGPSARA